MPTVARFFSTHVLKRAIVMAEGEKSAVIPETGLRITALSIDQLATVLSNAGGRKITEEMIRSDIEAGAPSNPDGTVNLIHYTAWLVSEVSDGA